MAGISIHNIKNTDADVRDLESFYTLNLKIYTETEYSGRREQEDLVLFFNNKEDLTRFAESLNASISHLL